jgi:outer membrane protein W
MFLSEGLIVATILFFSSYSQASLIYIKGQLGMSVATNGSIDGTDVNTQLAAPYPVTLGLGVHLTSMSSLALEINYETMDIEKLPPGLTSISEDTQVQTSAMLNYYFHFPEVIFIQPYFGVGAGYVDLKIEKNDFEGQSFTWQSSLGADIEYTSMLNFVLELRVFKPTDLDLDDQNNVNIGQFNTTQVKLLAGVKIKF